MEKRTCKYCGVTLDINQFEIANTVNGKQYRRWRCKTCYLKTKKERRKHIKQWLDEIKKTFSCSQCGDDDFRVLDFHHIEQNKDFTIGDALRRGYSQQRIEKEISKCEPLCCKCHRILHWEETHR